MPKLTQQELDDAMRNHILPMLTLDDEPAAGQDQASEPSGQGEEND